MAFTLCSCTVRDKDRDYGGNRLDGEEKRYIKSGSDYAVEEVIW